MSHFATWLLLLAAAPGPQGPPAALDCAVPEPEPASNPTMVGDGTPGSITADALQSALDGGGHIVLDQGGSPTSVVLDRELVVRRETVLDGGGLVTLDGAGTRRILLMDEPDPADPNADFGYQLTVQGLTFSNGLTNGNGAAIYKPLGQITFRTMSLYVLDSVFVGNTAAVSGADLGGGAIYATGLAEVVIANATFTDNAGSSGGAFFSLVNERIKIVDSTFTDNHATGTRPAGVSAIGDGGGIYIDGGDREVRLCNTVIANNTATALGKGFFTVMYDTLSRTDIVGSTISGNATGDPTASDVNSGGGIYVQGGLSRGCLAEPFNDQSAVFFAPCGYFSLSGSAITGNEADIGGGIHIAPLTQGVIVNSTFSGNVAENGLGGGFFVDDDANIEMLLNHLTITDNQAPGFNAFAGGIHVPPQNQITLANSILSNNTGGSNFGINNPWNITNPVVDGGGNIQFPQIRPNGEAEPLATSTTIFADPLLGPLASNGGETLTHALGLLSPAVDYSEVGSIVASPTTDQRGVTRAVADAGALELAELAIHADGFESMRF